MVLFGPFQEPLLEDLVPFGQLGSILGVVRAGLAQRLWEIDHQLMLRKALRLPPMGVELWHHSQDLSEGVHLKLLVAHGLNGLFDL